MKINSKLIDDIFSLKKKLKNKKDKEKLSKYQEIIPLYDIYSHLIYPIKFMDVEINLLDNHYRFITKTQKKILENYLKKVSDVKKLSEDEQEFKNKMEYNLKIIDNYDLDILEETSIKSFYLGSDKLGQSISVCRRKSFHPSLNHLNPYYTLNELIKMGQNNKLIKNNISPIELQDEELHYKICKNISRNDIKYKEILNHTKYLQDYENEIKFFSIFGSFFINQNLRYYNSNKSIMGIPFPEYLDYGTYINEIFQKSPGLENDYFLYRFIQNDDFIKNLKIGETFVEGGILSTTRNPFYSPDELKNFGMILLKITIPKNYDKLLLVEGISAFPFEQEIIFAPFTRMKLISKDNDFMYHHTNTKIEKSITKRYHFEVINQGEYPKIPRFEPKNLPIVSLESKLFAPTMQERIKEFILNFTSKNNLFQLRLNKKLITFYAKIFDSTDAYENIFSQRDDNGLALYCFDNYSMKYCIEISKNLVLNYQGRFFPDSYDLSEDETIELLGIFGKLFSKTTSKFYFDYTKNNNLTYCKLLDNQNYYKKPHIKMGFGFRDFKNKLNSNYTNNTHPYFVKKHKTWMNYFKFLVKENESLEQFYDEWEIKFNYDLEKNLFSEINLEDFYSMHNIVLNEIRDDNITLLESEYSVRQRD